MIIDADFRGLEWVTALYLSQDMVGIDELQDQTFNQLLDNKERLGLPSELVAKVFVFRLLFGGSADGYANDPDFRGISTTPKYWASVIDKFYDKYQGIGLWHTKLMQEVNSSGRLIMPTGRIYTFEPVLRNGERVYPRTQVLNYPVQGLGADLMTIIRIGLHREIRRARLLSVLISTVHDSILIDALQKELDKVCELVYNVWDQLPSNFEKCFGVPFNVPCRTKIKYGPDWGNMEVYKRGVL